MSKKDAIIQTLIKIYLSSLLVIFLGGTSVALYFFTADPTDIISTYIIVGMVGYLFLGIIVYGVIKIWGEHYDY